MTYAMDFGDDFDWSQLESKEFKRINAYFKKEGQKERKKEYDLEFRLKKKEQLRRLSLYGADAKLIRKESSKQDKVFSKSVQEYRKTLKFKIKSTAERRYGLALGRKRLIRELYVCLMTIRLIRRTEEYEQFKQACNMANDPYNINARRREKYQADIKESKIKQGNDIPSSQMDAKPEDRQNP